MLNFRNTLMVVKRQSLCGRVDGLTVRLTFLFFSNIYLDSVTQKLEALPSHAYISPELKVS